MSYELTEKETVTITESKNTLSRKVLKDKCYSLEESKSFLIKKIKSISTTKCFLLLFFSAIASQSVAQITTLGASMSEKKKANTSIEIPTYDSLSNFIKINGKYQHLIGQRAYCYKLPSGFSSLEKTYYREELIQRVVGKYFTIIDDENYNEYGIALKNDNEVFYLSSSCTPNHYFIIEGYFEKAKFLYEGKDLVFVKDDRSYEYDSYKFNGLFNLETRKRDTQIAKNTIWKCTGLSVDEKAFIYVENQSPVVLLLNNEKYGDYYCYLQSEDIIQNVAPEDYLLGKFLYREDYDKKQKNDAIAAKKKNEANQAKAKERQEKEQQRIQVLVDKYGQSNVNLARQGKVKIGWNKELCIEAWGKPRSVNKTTTAYGVHEQWAYSTSRYLYFDDGILTAIQE